MAEPEEKIEICPCCGRDNIGRTDYFVKFSHDFCLEMRTPLNSVIGFSDIILSGLDGTVTQQQRQDVEAIYYSGLQTLALLNDLIDVAKLTLGEIQLDFEVVDLNPFIYEIISALERHLADKTIQIHYELVSDLPLIGADRYRLRQLLHHLIEVFLRYTGDTLIIHCQPGDSSRVQISLIGEDWLVSEWGDDFNRLISQSDMLPLLPNHTDLFIVKTLTSLHGGRIWVEALNNNPAVHLSLPVSAAR